MRYKTTEATMSCQKKTGKEALGGGHRNVPFRDFDAKFSVLYVAR